LAIPLGIRGGVLLLKRRPVGYLLAAVALVKTTTLDLGLVVGQVALVITMAVSGLPVVIAEAAFAVIATILCGAAIRRQLVICRRPG
jgi:hypothetical protein